MLTASLLTVYEWSVNIIEGMEIFDKAKGFATHQDSGHATHLSIWLGFILVDLSASYFHSNIIEKSSGPFQTQRQTAENHYSLMLGVLACNHKVAGSA